jgi:hypothetical protein
MVTESGFNAGLCFSSNAVVAKRNNRSQIRRFIQHVEELTPLISANADYALTPINNISDF